MSGRIEIENGRPVKCPQCNNVILITNGSERLFKKVYVVHIKDTPDGQKIEVECRNCRKMVDINSLTK